MRKTYEIRFLPLAVQDMTAIADVLSAPQAAHALLNKIDEAAALLEQFPFAFSSYKDKAFEKLGYRALPVENYLLFYVIAGDVVEIRRVIYAKRDLPELLQ